MKDAQPEAPPERSATVRERLAEELRDTWVSARQLSSLVSVSEKALPDHLEHLRKSFGSRFEIEPAVCSKCDHVFDDRTRLTKPGRCPSCKGQRIEPPRFRIEP